ncbi:MAG TPA: YdeI/OmpD-associated family protein [Longimicrobium sp.]|jgi:uncharacterized protein YdeI (YjbR/CyaY-like superfamily)|uniref:YdeI/OmpD-associated family protein n=1 Tax=Longimicrobium sp. TaxID=2029185 RepID=UPI002ED81332
MPAAKTKPGENFPRVQAETVEEWRAWLAENHDSSPGVWLVTYKRDRDRPALPYAVSVEEALCFGWVDSVRYTLDEQRAMQMFTPRKRGSQWSGLNKRRVEQLIADGRMTDAGLRKIDEAKADGSWTIYDDVEAIVIPDDLEAALRADPAADAHFRAFSDSSRKVILWWIKSARTDATRQKRIAETVRLAAQNIKANHPRK